MELNSRFKPDSYGFLRATAACMPHSDTFGDKTLIKAKASHAKKEKFSSLVEVLDACPRDIFPKMNDSFVHRLAD